MVGRCLLQLRFKTSEPGSGVTTSVHQHTGEINSNGPRVADHAGGNQEGAGEAHRPGEGERAGLARSTG